MNNEIMLRYLYYLTQMLSGNVDKWEPCYTAWHNFAGNVGHEEYENLLTELNKFNKLYLNKDK